MKIKMPKTILVYVYDYDDGEPLYAVVNNIDELPADKDGYKVGVYTLQSINTFKVKRELQ